MSHTSTASWQVLVQRFLFKEMKVQVSVEKCHNVQKCWQEPKEKCWEVKLIMTGMEFYIILFRSPNKDVTKSPRRNVSKFRKRSVGRFEDIFEFCRLFFVNRSRGENAGKSLMRSAHR